MKMRVEFEPNDIRAMSCIVQIEEGGLVTSMMEAGATLSEGFREVKIGEEGSLESNLGRLRLPGWAVEKISLLARGNLPLAWDDEVDGYFLEQEMSDGSLSVFGEE